MRERERERERESYESGLYGCDTTAIGPRCGCKMMSKKPRMKNQTRLHLWINQIENVGGTLSLFSMGELYGNLLVEKTSSR